MVGEVPGEAVSGLAHGAELQRQIFSGEVGEPGERVGAVLQRPRFR